MNLNIPITIYSPTQTECNRLGWQYNKNQYCLVVGNFTGYWWSVLGTPFTLASVTRSWIEAAYNQGEEPKSRFAFSHKVFQTDDFAKDYPELLI